MGLKELGSITFWLDHEHSDWRTNDFGYEFARIDFEEYEISTLCTKHPNGYLEIIVSGPIYSTIRFLLKIPKHELRNELLVVITWHDHEMKVSLDAKESETVVVPEIKFSSICLTIQGSSSVVSLSSLGLLIFYTAELLNIGETLAANVGPLSANRIVASDIEASKFQLISSQHGSFIGVIKGTENAIGFLKNKVYEINAICRGYSIRLAEATVLRKEAEVRRLEAETEKSFAEKANILADAEKKLAEVEKIKAEAHHERIKAMQAQIDLFKQAHELYSAVDGAPAISPIIVDKHNRAIVEISNALAKDDLRLAITDPLES